MEIVLACVAENRPDFQRKVENLLLSWRAFGGETRSAPFVVNVVGDVDPAARDRYEQLGAEVRVVERYDFDRFNLANKLRMLELAESRSFDALLALDCDVVMVGDPTPHLFADAVGAATVDLDLIRPAEFDALWRSIDGDVPDDRRYFNSGVLLVPHGDCAALLEHWRGALDDVAGLWTAQPPALAPQRTFFSEQLALMVALRRHEVRTLPTAMNFPTHVRVRSGGSAPVVLHYHGLIDGHGFLMAPVSRTARGPAESFNRMRAVQLALPYDRSRRRSALARAVRALRRGVYQGVKPRLWYLRRRLHR